MVSKKLEIICIFRGKYNFSMSKGYTSVVKISVLIHDRSLSGSVNVWWFSPEGNVLFLKSNLPASFLKQHLNVAGPETADVEALRLQVSELQQKVEQLQDENKELKSKVKHQFSLLFALTRTKIRIVPPVCITTIICT